MDSPIIEVQNLKKYFNTPSGLLHAVDDISFHIEKGTTLGVVGESGCGKSTLGRVVLRLLEATSGKVLYNNENILEFETTRMREKRKDMQIIFQDPYSSLDPRMNVIDLIAEPLKVTKTITNRKMLYERAEILMQTAGLDPRFRYSFAHELDGGRRQRVGIARALATNPQFIVCDEPVSALDVSIQAQVLNLLMDLQDSQNLTYMFITHDMSVVKHISQKIMVMYLGKCVEMASCDELFEHPLHPYTVGLLNAIPVPDISSRNKKRELINGEVTSPINPKPGCRFALRCPYKKDSCLTNDIPLREVGTGHFVACNYCV